MTGGYRANKPRKAWEPEYRFGGGPSRFFMPLPLGQASGNAARKGKHKGKRG